MIKEISKITGMSYDEINHKAIKKVKSNLEVVIFDILAKEPKNYVTVSETGKYMGATFNANLLTEEIERQYSEVMENERVKRCQHLQM